MPRSKSTGCIAEQSLKEIAHLAIGACVADENSIVAVPGLLPPGVEDRFFPCVVRVNTGHDSIDGVIKQNGTDADLSVELEAVGRCEERLVFANGLPLIVVDRPATPYPTGRDIIAAVQNWT